jgi:hypothetical protein
VIRLLVLAPLLLIGCASMNEHLRVTLSDGTKIDYRLRSTVVGKGETELVTNADGALGYSTRGTGLSDNSKAALKDIADVVSKNMRPGAQLEDDLGEKLKGANSTDPIRGPEVLPFGAMPQVNSPPEGWTGWFSSDGAYVLDDRADPMGTVILH